MKKIVALLLAAVLVLSSAALVGCSFLTSEAVGVDRIVKTGTKDRVDTYTIYYTDGTTSTFDVTNGKDGTDGRVVKVTDVSLTSSEGGVDTYTISFSDGSSHSFLVKNGEAGVGVDRIERTSVGEVFDEYTVYLTNGESYTFIVTNGRDGEDVSAAELYDRYCELYGEIEYSEFLKMYLGGTVEGLGAAIAADALSSVGEVLSVFELDGATKQGAGSGVVYRMDEDYSYILTNFHVVYYDGSTNNGFPSRVSFCPYGSSLALVGEVVGSAACYDLALLRVKTDDLLLAQPTVCEVELAEGYDVGAEVLAIGNPGNMGISVTGGIISVDSEEINLAVDGITTRKHRVMRIDAALYQGNSGGGVFDMNGRLVGIASAGNGDEQQNINYAIPVGLVRRVAENLLCYYFDGDDATVNGYTVDAGIDVIASSSHYEYDYTAGKGRVVDSVRVDAVDLLGLGQRSGLLYGDLISAVIVDGVEHEVVRAFDIDEIMLEARLGSTLQFVYSRGALTGQLSQEVTVEEYMLVEIP
ncbi:MAG: trypsin-like peptidase domain-containing protein [Clostridia bacterium]|nr:trypsin-like peptidase domain-containing protein [Clostridia bacterium]